MPPLDTLLPVRDVYLQQELRRDAEERLRAVMHGASPEPLGAREARAMAQVAFAAPTSGMLGESPSPGRLAALFCALLSHPDLSEADLDWIAQDRIMSHPSVFAALLSHPCATLPVALRALKSTLWKSRGALDADDWLFNHPLVPVLRGSTQFGPPLTLLVSLWFEDDFAAFTSAARRLCSAPPEAVEILATLAEDYRLERNMRTFRLTPSQIESLLEKAVLLARPLPVSA